MKFLSTLFFLAVLVFGAWPYAYVYRLDVAVAKDDTETLQRLVDLDAVRGEFKHSLERGVGNTMGTQPSPALDWLRDGVKRLGAGAIDSMIDLQWVRKTLLSRSVADPRLGGSFIGDIDFAFFESYDSFIVRIGKLGASPLHVRMTLEGYNWRVTGIYE